MTKVDSKGRIVLPQKIREQLGLTPGTEVEVWEEDGKAVVEPEDDPDEILSRMEQLVKQASSEPGERDTMTEDSELIADKHKDTVRKDTEKTSDE